MASTRLIHKSDDRNGKSPEPATLDNAILKIRTGLGPTVLLLGRHLLVIQWGKMRIPRVAVIVEDDQDIRELISVILNQSGFEVHAASTGANGVDAVRANNPAVVTLDLGLPDIDGFEVARQIRLFSDAHVIMLTGRINEMDTLLALETGADDHLTKPFRPRELRARISAMMRRPRFAGEGPPAAAESTSGSASANPESSERPRIEQREPYRGSGRYRIGVDSHRIRSAPRPRGQR